MNFDLSAFFIAFAMSLPVSALFFWGLALSIKQSLHSQNPALILLSSFILRAVILLGFAYGLTLFLEPFSAVLGLSSAFLIARLASTAITRRGIRRATDAR